MTDQSLYFRGFARVRLDHLDLQTGREVDHKQVEYLCNVFEQEGCRHDQPDYSVPVVIQQEIMSSALRSHPSGVAGLPFSGTNAPMLTFSDDVQIVCLHGGHRITAARKFLKVRDQWWTVKVFGEGTVCDTMHCEQNSDDAQICRSRCNRKCNRTMNIASISRMATSSDTF